MARSYPRDTKPSEESSPDPGYPRRAELRAHATCDHSRRRFLGQLALGTGALGIGGLPRLAHGQSMEVDLSRLDGHPHVQDLASEAAASAPAAAAAAPEQSDGLAASAPAPMAAAPAPAPPALLPVTERRALWVEPGYLVLVEWRRPEDGTATIAALEGAATPVGDYLHQRVTSIDDLHQIDRLHAIELELVGLLNGLVAPAVIDVLHLDHDCATVCANLNGGTVPEVVPLGGAAVPTGWGE